VIKIYKKMKANIEKDTTPTITTISKVGDCNFNTRVQKSTHILHSNFQITKFISISFICLESVYVEHERV